jgi:DNA-binding SARP family transcriptional activator/WD40 repeat protein
MEVRVLGPLTLDGGRIPLTPRDRVVMAALVVRLGAPVSVESLATALWGEELPPSWPKVIPGCIMRLRRVIAPAVIETTSVGYRLSPEHLEVDAERFESLVAGGLQQRELGEPDRAAHTLSKALPLWGGEAYPELAEWEPGRIAADRLQEMRLGAEELLLDVQLQAGRAQEVIALARARVAEAPLRERRWAILSLAQYREGRQADALATVRRARGLLDSELGLELGPELSDLEQSILHQDTSLLSDRPFRTASPRCPYFGLPPARISDAGRYFGREAELSRALRALEDDGVLLVTGSSGVGKSSFVRAGIGADIAAHGGHVVVVTPGQHPLEALRDLSLPPGDSLLIVDQCEEVFAAADPAEVRHFFGILTALILQTPVVIAIRADRLGHLAEHDGFAGIIQSHLLMLTPLDRAGLRAVIEKPAEQAGLILEPGLVEILVRDADARSLPLLSHALTQVWSRREGRVMTVEGYRGSGEIQGAIAQTAETVFAALSPDEGRMLRDILLRLVEAAPDGALVARRVDHALLAVDDAHARIVDRLVDARLLTTDEESVQVSHEALAREWPRLNEWLGDDIEGQRIMRHLSAAASAWDTMGRPDSELYRGRRLTAAQHWRESAHPALTAVEDEFLDAASASETATLLAAQGQLRQERRMVRRLSLLSAAAAGVAVIAVTAGLIAGIQASIAGERATVGEARRVAALAVEEPQLDLALLAAVEAVHLWDSPETRRNLLRVISRAPRVTSIMHVADGGAALVSMSMSSSGTSASVIDADADVTLIDLDHRAQLGEYAPFGGRILASAIDPVSGRVVFSLGSGSCAGVVCEDGRVGTLDLAHGGRSGVTAYEGLESTATDVEYSQDGSLLAAFAPGSPSGTSPAAALWRTRGAAVDDPIVVDITPSGTAGGSLDDPLRGGLTFSPDGSRLYVSGSGDTIVFDTASGAELSRIPGSQILAVSRNGERVAVRAGASSVRIVDPSGQAAPVSIPLSLAAAAADFSPVSGHLAVVTGTDVIVTDSKSGRVLETLSEHDDMVVAARFRPSGELVTASADGDILTWDLTDWWDRAGFTTSVLGDDLIERDDRTATLALPDQMTRVIVAEPAAWEERACRAAGRALTAQEWENLLGGRPYNPSCTP